MELKEAKMEVELEPMNGGSIKKSISSGIERSMSFDSANYDEFYRNLAGLLPEKKFTVKQLRFSTVCNALSLLSSLYYLALGSAYVREVALRWGLSEADATLFGEFCGYVSVLTNTSINSLSIEKGYDVIKTKIWEPLKIKSKRSDDNSARITSITTLILSAIGAVPNMKFVYDSTKDSNQLYLILMLIVQFFVVTALNFRGVHNLLTAKFRKEENSIAYKLKKELLKNLNKMLTKKLSDQEIVALTHGELVLKKLPIIRLILGILFGLYTFGYSSAFYFAVQDAMPTSDFNNFIDDIFSAAAIAFGVLSAGLKFLFLGYAYYMLLDKVSSLFDPYILKTGKTKVSGEFITQNGQRWLALLGIITAFFTLGSSSRIVEKYFFGDVEKTAETFWMALILGGGAAFGINAGDLMSLFERLINFAVFIVTTKIFHYDSTYRFGKTHDEMIMRIMLRIAKMSDAEFLKEFTVEVTEKNLETKKSELAEDEYKALKQLKDEHKTMFHLYSRNRFFTEVARAGDVLDKVENNAPFCEFKERMQMEEQGFSPMDYQSPYLSKV